MAIEGRAMPLRLCNRPIQAYIYEHAIVIIYPILSFFFICTNTPGVSKTFNGVI